MILEYDGGASELDTSIEVFTEGWWVPYSSLIGVAVPDCQEHRLLNCIKYARGNSPNSFLTSALRKCTQTVLIDDETEACSFFFQQED